MKIVTRIITIPTILALAAVLGIWLQTTSKSDNNYVLSVTWRPTALPGQNKVRILASVDGVPMISRERRISPWGETMTATPGAAVSLTAEAGHQSIQLLDCMILVNGRSVPGDGHKNILHPGTVTCTA